MSIGLPSNNSALRDLPGFEKDLNAISTYFAGRPEVVVAYLFGSVARGPANALSDVNIAVLLDAGIDERTSVEVQLQFMIDLDDYAHRDVQVTILNRAPPLLACQVIRYGKLLHERSRGERIDFEVRARKIYFDVKPMLEFFNQVAIQRIKERSDGTVARTSRHSRTLKAAEWLHQRLVDTGKTLTHIARVQSSVA